MIGDTGTLLAHSGVNQRMKSESINQNLIKLHYCHDEKQLLVMIALHVYTLISQFSSN